MNSTMNTTIDLTGCTFIREKKLLIAPSDLFGGFPNKVLIISTATGKSVVFETDVESAIANEFWDGEMCEYKPTIPVDTVTKLVIRNQ